jgi:NAD+ kinase
MKLRKVLVIYKKSALELYTKERKSPRVLSMLRSGHPVTRRFVPSHRSHYEALAMVREILERRRIAAEFVYRARPFREQGIDLVLTVGGDGTFLDAAHSLTRCPILGLNSSPNDSVGLLCGTVPDRFEEMLDAIELGRAKPIELARLAIRIGRRKLPFPVLNDALIAHANPAATSKLIFERYNDRFDFKCSGVWIAPPAGTTAALASAGGKVMSIRSRGFQFVVREPYPRNGSVLGKARGILRADEELVMYSKMRNGRVYVDGAHSQFPFHLGERLVVSTSAPPLRVFGFDEKRRRRLFR